MQFAQWCSHLMLALECRQIKRHSVRTSGQSGGRSQAATSPDSFTVPWGGRKNWAKDRPGLKRAGRRL